MSLLLIVSTILSFVTAHSYLLGRLLVKWNSSPTSEEKQLLKEKKALKTEQLQYNMMDHFAKYSKIQRKINVIDERLKESGDTKTSFIWKNVLNYGPQVVCTIILIILTIFYRRTPVFKLPEYIDLTPFNYIISYPNERNYVSFHFWIMSCNVVFRLLKL